MAAPPPIQEDALAAEPKVQPSFFGWQLGLRAGLNFNSYGSPGIQLGFVHDIAITKWLYFQPRIMYTQMIVHEGSYSGSNPNYLYLPLLLSLKFSVSNEFALRLNAGPYFGLCIDDGGYDVGNFGSGLSLGAGFDIRMFYIGAFSEGSHRPSLFANGLQVGVNL